MINILFYNRKGGQGKTTHAIGLALYIKAFYITNDYDNSTAEVYSKLFPAKKFVELMPDSELTYNDDYNNVFDFGGFSDQRVITVAKFVDKVVIPISYQSAADLLPSIKTIEEMEKHNKNLILLINNTDKDYVPELREALQNIFDYPVFVIPRSRYISRLADEGKTVFDLFQAGGLEKFMLRNLVPELEKIYNNLLLKGK